MRSSATEARAGEASRQRIPIVGLCELNLEVKGKEWVKRVAEGIFIGQSFPGIFGRRAPDLTRAGLT